MRLPSIYPLPGIYQYTYPTFIDTPQQICIHFFTPDHQKAFVTYPHNRHHKVAQLIDVSWFRSVTLLQLDGQPQLMHFLEVIFSEWLGSSSNKLEILDSRPNEQEQYPVNKRLAA